MASDEPDEQDVAESLDDAKIEGGTEYGVDDEAVEPKDRPMGAEEIHTDHPDPLTVAEREELRGWRESDAPSTGVRIVDDAAAVEDEEQELIAEAWESTPDVSAEEAAVDAGVPSAARPITEAEADADVEVEAEAEVEAEVEARAANPEAEDEAGGVEREGIDDRIGGEAEGDG